MTKSIALLLAVVAAGAASPALAQMQFEPGEMLARADADGDGRITRAENRAAREQTFARIDRNGDGMITSQDLPGRRSGERLQKLIASLDADGDGRASRKEFVEGRTVAFDRADANHDGAVDRDELASFREAAAQLRSR
ncbi:conserved hypothetical protein [Altererythrobacter sp. B11]|uniref:EF-hand domain-containing protein n=1 Tax=Altererythrobacter sp. B11 TaxID=2060312 RepID=UPI000DC6D608|nr:EF-hand domain-containing protein [Altererythrobacter sp. B11]BBC71891.1 conserved hypothetical protein [Altererythrobacter sp. B11]